MKVHVRTPDGRIIDCDTASEKPYERLLARLFPLMRLQCECGEALESIEEYCHQCGRVSNDFNENALLRESNVATIEEVLEVWGCTKGHPDDMQLTGHCPVCGVKLAK